MTIQPSRHLVLINGYSHQGPQYEGDSHLSYGDPYALADCWRDYFNNEILDIVQDLWKNYHFVGNTGRIPIFTTRPYSTSIPGLQRIGYIDPRQFIIRNLDYEPLLYCGFYNQYAMYHEHDCNYNPPWDPYDGCPSDAYDTDQNSQSQGWIALRLIRSSVSSIRIFLLKFRKLLLNHQGPSL